MVDESSNDYAAKKMGIDHKGQVCVMIHSGSRGLGHQVATGRTALSTHVGNMHFRFKELSVTWSPVCVAARCIGSCLGQVVVVNGVFFNDLPG